jgi:hypothetical protein
MLAPTHRAPNISPAISAERKTSECIGVVRKFHDPTHFFISASLHEFNNIWQPVTSSNVGVDSYTKGGKKFFVAAYDVFEFVLGKN